MKKLALFLIGRGKSVLLYLDDFRTHAFTFNIDLVHVALEIQVQELEDEVQLRVEMHDVQ